MSPDTCGHHVAWFVKIHVNRDTPNETNTSRRKTNTGFEDFCSEIILPRGNHFRSFVSSTSFKTSALHFSKPTLNMKDMIKPFQIEVNCLYSI